MIDPKKITKIAEPEIKEFVFFAKELEIVKLAFGVTIGGAVLKLVTSLVTNVINPLVAIFTGRIDFNDFTLNIFGAKILMGTFLSSIIDFTIVIIVVFIALKKLGLKKLTKGTDKVTAEI